MCPTGVLSHCFSGPSTALELDPALFLLSMRPTAIMAISDHFRFPSIEEEGAYRPSPSPTKGFPSAFASPKGGEATNCRLSAARWLEESREALSWSSGRCIEVPIPTTSSTTATSDLRVTNAASYLASTRSNSCSTYTKHNASCMPSLAMTPSSSENVSRRTMSMERADVTYPTLPLAS